MEPDLRAPYDPVPKVDVLRLNGCEDTGRDLERVAKIRSGLERALRGGVFREGVKPVRDLVRRRGVARSQRSEDRLCGEFGERLHRPNSLRPCGRYHL